MTCLKCGIEKQYGNFCSNCAQPLKEKCAECGEMERVERKVCETKLYEAQEKFNGHTRLKEAYNFLLASLALFTPWSVNYWGYKVMFGHAPSDDFAFAMFSVSLFESFCCFILFTYIQKIVEKKKTEEFNRLYPDYAEIIKKGGAR